MIEPISATSASTTRPSGTTRATSSTSGGTSFSKELEKASTKQRPDGEQTRKVSGHHYAKIMNGDDKGLYLNQLDDSPREGQAFKKVARDDRVFHVYGEGKSRVVVEVKTTPTRTP